MTWTIITDPLNSLPLSALLAALPIFYLFWALAVKRMKGHWAAISAVGFALAIAIAGYGMPAKYALLATFDGMLFGLWPVAWIVLTAVFIYNLSVRTGQFESHKQSWPLYPMTGVCRLFLSPFHSALFWKERPGSERRWQSRLQCLAGLGFVPLYAAGVCLLANTAPVAFGAIGIPIIVAGQVSGVDTMAISKMVGRTLPFLSVLIPLYLVIVISGWKKGLEVWPAALVCGGSFAITQFLTSNYLGPMLPDILASIVSITCTVFFLRIWHPKQSWRFEHEPASVGREKLLYSGGQVFRAWAPFLLLSIFVAAWGIKSVKEFLDHYTLFKLAIPGLHNMIVRDGKPMPAIYIFNLMSAAGTAILLSGIFSIPVMGASLQTAAQVAASTVKTLRWAVVTISTVLGFAYIWNFSGMAISLSLAFAATGKLFPFFAAFLGWLGVFMTGSDTSTNALFGKLQAVTAAKLGVDPVVTVAANTAGGVCGKMISPQSIAVATASTNLIGREGDIFRFTLKHSVILTTIIAVMAYMQAYVIKWIVPVYSTATAAAGTAAAAAQADLSIGGTYLAVALLIVLAITFLARAVGRGEETATAPTH